MELCAGEPENEPSMALVFGCVSFASVQCSFDVSSSDGSYDGALAEFTACANRDQPPGYCRASLANAQYLRNEDVCEGGVNSDIGFHITIPFRCNLAGTYHFRFHADYGRGSHIGVDGAQHSPGNLWGHIMVDDVRLREGDHNFEALGFEDCCDGHAELEVHFPCDFPQSVWRTVHSGSDTWLATTCLAMPPSQCPAPAECAMDTDSAASCGSAGGSVACAAAGAAELVHGSARLSSNPQGRIEVWNEHIGSW